MEDEIHEPEVKSEVEEAELGDAKDDLKPDEPTVEMEQEVPMKANAEAEKGGRLDQEN
jgi:hypothetical protein